MKRRRKASGTAMCSKLRRTRRRPPAIQSSRGPVLARSGGRRSGYRICLSDRRSSQRIRLLSLHSESTQGQARIAGSGRPPAGGQGGGCTKHEPDHRQAMRRIHARVDRYRESRSRSRPSRRTAASRLQSHPARQRSFSIRLGRSGAFQFARGEGLWYSAGKLYIVDTATGVDGDDRGRGKGAVWELDLATMKLKAIFVSDDQLVGNNPDNITVSPRGGIIAVRRRRQLDRCFRRRHATARNQRARRLVHFLQEQC